MDRRELNTVLENLVDLICDAFTVDEFHQLVDRLDDSALAELHTDKALKFQVWEATRWAHRRGMPLLVSLARLAAEERKHQPGFQGVLKRLQNGTRPEGADAGDGSGVAPMPVTSDRVDDVVTWLSDPRIARAIAIYRQEVRLIKQQIDLLAGYKSLHDCLHQLQFAYASLEKAARALSEPRPDPDAVDEMDGLLASI
jgi:hypothetical protein